ncbi:MAG: acetyltransferase [Candidatus Melainabacteria bacterium GWF2_37_15]|nr:MAG: acetyltransferase [Candidatus Melainabacteria bacterium GWF2_37_15]
MKNKSKIILKYIKDFLINLLFQKPRILKYRLLSNISFFEGKPVLRQPALFAGFGKIIMGQKVIIGVKNSPYFYDSYTYVEARNKNSFIKIDNNVQINNKCCFISEGEGIFIGENTLIGTNVEIYDSDFHNLMPQARITGSPKTAKVIIDKNVFIGSNVKILKGVKIGKNSVIGTGSVVVKSIPDNVIAGGVPAKVIRNLD